MYCECLPVHVDIHVLCTCTVPSTYLSYVYMYMQVSFHSFCTNDEVNQVGTIPTEPGRSGYPTLAPSSHALSQAIISIILQVQDCDGWKQAITRGLGQRYDKLCTIRV